MMPSVSVLTRIIPDLYDLIYFVKPKICRLDSGFYIYLYILYIYIYRYIIYIMGLNN